MKVGVKICGITSLADGRSAVAAGADAIGFVFWERSPRRVSPEAAAAIASALPPFVTRVGVFVDEAPARIAAIAEAVGLDVVQLHGDESPAWLAELPRRAVKALRFGPDTRRALEPWTSRGIGVLLDAGSAALPGGTGRRLDWEQVAALRDAVPWLALAGGLNADNVAEALRTVAPDAVDVSSGVESAPGRKDPQRVAAFVRAVHAASAARP